MHEENFYYVEPSDEDFLDLKYCAIKLWYGIANDPLYAKEKADQVEKMQNISDNFMYIVAMFSSNNQLLLSLKLQPSTKEAIKKRLIAGGADADTLINF